MSKYKFIIEYNNQYVGYIDMGKDKNIKKILFDSNPINDVYMLVPCYINVDDDRCDLFTSTGDILNLNTQKYPFKIIIFLENKPIYRWDYCWARESAEDPDDWYIAVDYLADLRNDNPINV